MSYEQERKRLFERGVLECCVKTVPMLLAIIKGAPPILLPRQEWNHHYFRESTNLEDNSGVGIDRGYYIISNLVRLLNEEQDKAVKILAIGDNAVRGNLSGRFYSSGYIGMAGANHKLKDDILSKID
jgi:hypothetical protein